MIRQNQQVVILPLAVAGMLGEYAFDAEAQPLEDRPAGLLFFNYFDDHLASAQVASSVEDRMCQRHADAGAPTLGAHEQHNIGNMTRPTVQPPHRAIADDLAISFHDNLAPIFG